MTDDLMTNEMRFGHWCLVIGHLRYKPGAIFSSFPCLDAFSFSPLGPMTVIYSVPSGAKASAVGLSRLAILLVFTPVCEASMRNRPPSSGFIQAKSVA